MGPCQRTPKGVAIELLDTQVYGLFSGSCWRFLGLNYQFIGSLSKTNTRPPIPSMGRLYIYIYTPTSMIGFYAKLIGKHTSHMDAMGP